MDRQTDDWCGVTCGRPRVTLGRLALKNPVLVASGTFGYVREMAPFVRLERLGGVIPKTVTFQPRAGNPTPRTVETASGLLNAIGLDNDGIAHFIEHHLPYLRTVGTAVIANIAGEDEDQFVAMAEMLGAEPGLAAIELNISCPNVSHGLDLGIDASAGRPAGAPGPRGLPAADHRQADAERDRHRADRRGGGRGRRRRRQPDQHPPRHGRRLADAPADPGLRRRRALAARRSSRSRCGWSGTSPAPCPGCRSSASAGSPRPTTPSSSSSPAPRPSRSAPPLSTTPPPPSACSTT